MKKIYSIALALGFLIIPFTVSALSVSWDRYIVGAIRELFPTDKVLIGASATTTNATLEVAGSLAIASTTGGCVQGNNIGLLSFTGTSCGGSSLTGTTGQNAYFSGTNTAAGTSTIFTSTASLVGIGTNGATTTPWGLLSINPNALGNVPEFVIGSSTKTHFIITGGGLAGIGTTSPNGPLAVYSGVNEYFKVNTNGGIAVGLGTDISAFSGDGFDVIGANGSDLITNIQNFSAGVASSLILNANSNFSSISVVGTGSQWKFGQNGSTAFQLFDITNSKTAISVASGGFSTTTLLGLTVTGSATSTSNVGFNITTGCYAINGTCLSTSGSTLTGTTGQNAYFSGTNTAVGTSTIFTDTTSKVGIASSTPFAQLSLNSYSGSPSFSIGSSTGTQFIVNKSGNIGIGTSSPFAPLSVVGDGFFTGNLGSTNVTAKGANSQFSLINTNDSATKNGYFQISYDGLEFGYVDTNNLLYMGKLALGGTTYIGTAHTVAVALKSNIVNMIDDGSGNAYFSALTGFGTTTNVYPITGYSATLPQLSLSAGSGLSQWTFRNAGGNLYFSTTTVAGTATTSTSALVILNNGSFGLGTTTPTSLLSVETASSTTGTAQATPFSQLLAGTIAGVKYMFSSFDYYFHYYTSGPTPTVSGGTSSMNTPSNDQNGSIAVAGVALTSVTMTFANPWLTAPSCQESDNVLAVATDITSISTTQIVFGFGTGGVTSATLWYRCTGTR